VITEIVRKFNIESKDHLAENKVKETPEQAVED